MRFAFATRRSLVLALVMLGACRGRPSPPPVVEWKAAVAERAALLVLDADGAAKLVCLPGHAAANQLFANVALNRILDVGWRGGPVVAGCAAPSGETCQDNLMLLAPNAEPRRLATKVRTAHFSPDGAALAYDVEGSVPTSYVLDLATAKLTELPAFADPLWEADGVHLRGTYLRAATTAEPQKSRPPVTSLRARWDRTSGEMLFWGAGSAQIPAPTGMTVAWSEDARGASDRKDCRLLVGSIAIHHTTAGSFCMGIADDRAVRWSADGQWLAFPHPSLGDGASRRIALDVIGLAGGRAAMLSSLEARVGLVPLAVTPSPGSLWLDWSPSRTMLALQDAAHDVHIYDFQGQGVATLGKGERPTWSPAGGYLSMLSRARDAGTFPAEDGGGSAPVAFVLPGVAPGTWVNLGAASDVHWLSAEACPQ